MKLVALSAALLMALSTVCLAEGYQLSRETADYKVVMIFAQASPVEGKNNVEILVTDMKSRPVKDARLKVEYLMPSLPGKKPMMDYTTTATPDGNVYKATLDLSMRGQWKAIITVVKGRQERKLSFSFEVK
jgi:hypothetical protein